MDLLSSTTMKHLIGRRVPPSSNSNFMPPPQCQGFTSFFQPFVSVTVESPMFEVMNINFNCAYVPSGLSSFPPATMDVGSGNLPLDYSSHETAAKCLEESVMNLMQPHLMDRLAKASKLNPDAPEFHPRGEYPKLESTVLSSSPSISDVMREQMGFSSMPSRSGRNSPILKERHVWVELRDTADNRSADQPDENSSLQQRGCREGTTPPSESSLSPTDSEIMAERNVKGINSGCDISSTSERPWKNCKNPHLANLLGSDGEESEDEGTDDDWDCVDDYDPDSRVRLPPPVIDLENFEGSENSGRKAHSISVSNRECCAVSRRDEPAVSAVKPTQSFKNPFLADLLCDSDEEADADDEDWDCVEDYDPTKPANSSQFSVFPVDSNEVLASRMSSISTKMSCEKPVKNSRSKVKGRLLQDQDPEQEAESWIHFEDVVDGDWSRIPSMERIDRAPVRELRPGEKRVRFAPEAKLLEVHPYVKWEYAYRQARPGPWERFTLDRHRFRERIDSLANDLSPILSQEHRERIYRERFAGLEPEVDV